MKLNQLPWHPSEDRPHGELRQKPGTTDWVTTDDTPISSLMQAIEPGAEFEVSYVIPRLEPDVSDDFDEAVPDLMLLYIEPPGNLHVLCAWPDAERPDVQLRAEWATGDEPEIEDLGEVSRILGWSPSQTAEIEDWMLRLCKRAVESSDDMQYAAERIFADLSAGRLITMPTADEVVEQGAIATMMLEIGPDDDTVEERLRDLFLTDQALLWTAIDTHFRSTYLLEISGYFASEV